MISKISVKTCPRLSRTLADKRAGKGVIVAGLRQGKAVPDDVCGKTCLKGLSAESGLNHFSAKA